MGDSDGFRRGAKGIDGDKGHADFQRPGDDGNKASRDISTREFKSVVAPWDCDTWKPGPLAHKGDSSPRYAPKGDAGTKSPSAASPSGKYAKTGGKGKGFGS